MELFGFNITDLAVFTIILLSGALAFAGGFVKEALAVASWVGAAFATLYGFNYVSPYARELISATLIADVAAGAVLFIGTLILLSLVSHAISSRVRGSGLGALDRSLGFLFGLLRGALLISLAYLVLDLAQPRAEQPQWLRSAKTMPLIERGAEILIALVPERFGLGPGAREEAERKAKRMREAERALRELTTSRTKAGASDDGSGYKDEERREMDRLIQGAQ